MDILRTLLIAIRFVIDQSSQNAANDQIRNFADNAIKQLKSIGSVAAAIAFDKIVENLLKVSGSAEEVSFRFQNIYGDLADAQAEWAEEFADTYNRSAVVVKDSLADIQQSLMGFSPAADRAGLADLSKQIEELALNLGAFYGMDESTSVSTLLSAVEGSTGAMQQFGITDFAKYRHQAMRDVGITDRSYELLTQYEKALVNYQVVLNANKGALDALSKSQDNYNVKQKNYKESLDELKKVLGEFFLPTAKTILDILIKFVRLLTDGISTIKKFTDALGITKPLMDTLVAAFIALVAIDVVRWIRNIITMLRGLVGGLGQANMTVAGVIAIAVLLYGIIQDINNYLDGKESSIGKLFEKLGISAEQGAKLAEALKYVIIGLTAALVVARVATLAFGTALQATPIGGILAAITLLATGLALLVKNWDGITSSVSNWGETASNWISKTADKISDWSSKVSDWVSGAIEKVKGVFTSIWDWVEEHSDILLAFMGPVGWVVLLIKHLDKVKELARDIWGFIKNLFGFSVEPVEQSGTGEESGEDLAKGMAEGIRKGTPEAGQAAAALADEVADYVQFSLPKKGPLSHFDKSMPDMIDMMATGLRNGRAKVASAARGVANSIKGAVGGASIAVDAGSASMTVEMLLTEGNAKLQQILDALRAMSGLKTAQAIAGVATSSLITIRPIFTFTQNFGPNTDAQAMQVAAEQSGEDITSSLSRLLRSLLW